jgi:hypothetical protein
MPTYKYAPLNVDSESGGAGGDRGEAKTFEADPFAKKRDLCVGLYVVPCPSPIFLPFVLWYP